MDGPVLSGRADVSAGEGSARRTESNAERCFARDSLQQTQDQSDIPEDEL